MVRDVVSFNSSTLFGLFAHFLYPMLHCVHLNAYFLDWFDASLKLIIDLLWVYLAHIFEYFENTL